MGGHKANHGRTVEWEIVSPCGGGGGWEDRWFRVSINQTGFGSQEDVQDKLEGTQLEAEAE